MENIKVGEIYGSTEHLHAVIVTAINEDGSIVYEFYEPSRLAFTAPSKDVFLKKYTRQNDSVWSQHIFKYVRQYSLTLKKE